MMTADNKEFWCPMRVGFLTASWKRGETASEIAVVLGVTRNAVLGKLNRLGLVGLNAPLDRKRNIAARQMRVSA